MYVYAVHLFVCNKWQKKYIDTSDITYEDEIGKSREKPTPKTRET